MKKRKRRLSRLTRNRLLYMLVMLIVLTVAWTYGGRMMYVTLYTLILLPGLSLLFTLMVLYGLRITQRAEQTQIVKEEPGCYYIFVRNYMPFAYDAIECVFVDETFAVETDRAAATVSIRPFMRESRRVPFTVKYRGEYMLGLQALQTTDLLGLFTLRRGLKDTIQLTVLPRVMEISYFPLAMNLLSQAQSNFEIREEDYATVSDIRQYEQSDSIKRVHWKLSAKREEWMTKIFQSNALNRITVLIDTTRLPLPYEDYLPLEDRMIETALAIIRYCLWRSMPVVFWIGGEAKKEGRLPGEFDGFYQIGADIVFTADEGQNRLLEPLNRCLNESVSYMNVVILTAKLDEAVYDRVVSANHTGHFVAVMYFAPNRPDPVSDNVYQMLADVGAPCHRIAGGDDLL